MVLSSVGSRLCAGGTGGKYNSSISQSSEELMPHSGSTGLIAAPGKLVKLVETNTNRISEHMDTEFIEKSQYS